MESYGAFEAGQALCRFQGPVADCARPPGDSPGPANGTAGSLVLNISTSVQPGTYSLVFRSFALVPYNKDPLAKARPPINVVQASTPLTLIVLPKKVATVSVDNPNPSIKIGMQGDVVVR